MQRSTSSLAESGYFKELGESTNKLPVAPEEQGVLQWVLERAATAQETAENVIEWSLIGYRTVGSVAWVLATFGFVVTYPLLRVAISEAMIEAAPAAVVEEDFSAL